MDARRLDGPLDALAGIAVELGGRAGPSGATRHRQHVAQAWQLLLRQAAHW